MDTPTTDEGRRSPPLPVLYAVLVGTAAVIVILDQVTKHFALRALSDGQVIDVIDGILTLRLALNPGGAFGILAGAPAFFLIATVLVIGFIVIWARKVEDLRWAVALGLVLGGGMGNLVDRVLRDLDGRVVDFIDLQIWPVFNLADSAIVVGVILLLLLSLRSPST